MALTRKFLKALGLEDDKIEQIIEEHTALADRMNAEIEKYKADAEKLPAVQRELDSLKNSPDAEAVKKQLEDLQSKYNSEMEQYKKQLADRDYADAMTRAIAEKGVKFSSKAAERAYIADLKAKALELKDGALVGFDKYHEEQLAADPSAFASDKPAPFVKPIGPGGPPAVKSKGAMYAEQFNAQYAQTKK